MELLKKGTLAKAMGCGPSYVSAMIRAGYRMQYGQVTTLIHALEWRGEHPDFRFADSYPMKSPRSKQRRKDQRASVPSKSS